MAMDSHRARAASGGGSGSGASPYAVRLTGVGRPAGIVAVSVAQSGVAAVAAVSVAVTPLGSRAVTTPVTVTSSPSSTGFLKRTLAVPRDSQAVPNAATRGCVMYA